ncbi:hypothetical protein HHL19_18950 [Streptomyces sp. R302]|uniref:DUF6083 domain-containing protein n=1 Tax=unclassified Streptomyces TaxID=2593676 RepID=UPI00145D701E|nr:MULTISPECIES: DUF6083 domain-containing protein [unclassified Streptomyces]NML54742.1 hypothetical protein [Streptomyces sp. R301]NML80689.1 hypothetical protein [Streptomyces sp. R302]
MRPRPDTPHHRDGTFHTRRPRRTLTVAHDSPSRLLRCAQSARCPRCGNRIDRHTTTGPRPVSLHPGELPTELVPADYRWHLASGVAYPAGDGSPWCRIAHPAVCPAGTHPADLPDSLNAISRKLALHTRHLIDTAAFTTPPSPPPITPEEPACRPQRPVVQLLYTRYLAPVPVEDIQCVAQTVRRTRCATPVLAPGTVAGCWTLMPTTPHTQSSRKLTLAARDIAVYDLTHLSYREQIRWRTQHCPTHAASTAAPDLALADWEPFDPLLHHPFTATRLPTNPRPHR